MYENALRPSTLRPDTVHISDTPTIPHLALPRAAALPHPALSDILPRAPQLLRRPPGARPPHHHGSAAVREAIIVYTLYTFLY